MRGIFWEITSRCNLRCKHCYLQNELTGPHNPTNNELNTQDCLKVVEQLDEVNAFRVTILGGEPFTRPDMMTILRHLGEKRFWTRVDTNGTLIDKNAARDLLDTGIKGVNLSLEGPNAETNDTIRGKKSFEKAIQGIKYLQDFGIPFYIGMVVNKMNYTEVEKMAEFCLNIGSKTVTFALYVDFPSNHFSSSLRMGKKEIFTAAKTIDKIRTEYPEGFISSDIHSYLGFFSPEAKNATNEKFIRCGLGATQLVILSNGDVIPCTYIRDKILGNVMKTPLSDIPLLPSFQEFKELRKITVDKANKQCAACEWRCFCGGGCRGRAYLAHGSLLAPDPQMCLLARGEVHG